MGMRWEDRVNERFGNPWWLHPLLVVWLYFPLGYVLIVLALLWLIGVR